MKRYKTMPLSCRIRARLSNTHMSSEHEYICRLCGAPRRRSLPPCAAAWSRVRKTCSYVRKPETRNQKSDPRQHTDICIYKRTIKQ